MLVADGAKTSVHITGPQYGLYVIDAATGRVSALPGSVGRPIVAA